MISIQGDSIEGVPEAPQTSQHYGIEELKGGPSIWTPVSPSNFYSQAIPKSAAVETVVPAEKYFRNLIKSNRNQIVFTIFPLI